MSGTQDMIIAAGCESMSRVQMIGRIELANAFDLVAKEIEAERLLPARGPEIDEAAAHRIFAGVSVRT